ncbi:MAG: leucine-rich repeat protein [Clostridia bacterium]|nr:leucine-rich repeat protein [Clostridia bacterium]
MKKRVLSFFLMLITALSLIFTATLSSFAVDENEGTDKALGAFKELSAVITLPDGTDITGEMTDNSYGSYQGDLTWYYEREGYRWTVEGGKLIIGGTGAVEESSYPWTRFSEEITEIVVLPGSVSSIGKNAFAGLGKVQKISLGKGVSAIGEKAFACGADGLTVSIFADVKSVGAKVLDGCKNVKVVLNNGTKDALMGGVNADNDVLAGAAFVENTVGALTVTPYTEGGLAGFENKDGATQLLTVLKDAQGNNVDLSAYTVRLIFTDGQRIRENGGWFSAAMKLSDIAPASKDDAIGLWRFKICEAEGENQFIPQYDSSYVVTVELYGADGVLAYTGASGVNKFKVQEEPIYDQVTATPGYAAAENYLNVDFGEEVSLSKLEVGFYQDSGRYYHFDIYATNDPTLPLSKWTYIGEQHDETPSEGSYTFTFDSEGAAYRYYRIYGIYNSSNWALHFAEVHGFVESDLQNVTFVVDGKETVKQFLLGEIPVVEDPFKNPIYGEKEETFYVFLGWSDGKTLYEPGCALPEVTGDVTYTAVFEELTDDGSKPIEPPANSPVNSPADSSVDPSADSSADPSAPSGEDPSDDSSADPLVIGAIVAVGSVVVIVVAVVIFKKVSGKKSN